MRYPAIGEDDAAIVLGAFRKGAGAAAPEVVQRGVGKDFQTAVVEDLMDALTALRKEIGEPDGGPRDYWARFEGAASVLVHTVLDIPGGVATDPGFWLWLVFGRADDRLIRLVDWRHEKHDELGGAADGNYGIGGNLPEGLLSRLWFRADIAYDASAADPYDLARRGDQDLWRSHIFRQEYGHVRPVARALIRYQYPDAGPDRRRLTNKVIRELAKELRRLHATLAFELLSEADARILLQDAHSRLPT